LSDDNTAADDGAALLLTLVLIVDLILILTWVLLRVLHPQVYGGSGFSAMFSGLLFGLVIRFLRLIEFVGFGMESFGDVDVKERRMRIQKHKDGPPPHSSHTPEPGRMGTQFKNFVRGRAALLVTLN
jgi:hypothetical protein